MKWITSCDENVKILRSLRDNDADLTELRICDSDAFAGLGGDDGECEYHLTSSDEMGWLGYFIGNNTNLQKLELISNGLITSNLRQFCTGLRWNKSIRKIWFHGFSGDEASPFEILVPFFKGNHNLKEILLADCHLGAEECRLLSLALAQCGKSLNSFEIEFGPGSENDFDGRLSDIIVALSVHPQLRNLRLSDVNIGRCERMALATLLRWTTTRIRTLVLTLNVMGDEGVEALVGALENGNQLRRLDISYDRSITARGCRAIATLLANPDSTLEDLSMREVDESINDEGLFIFAGALAKNHKLKKLDLCQHGGTFKGWDAFSKLLCDTSSVNNTFLSNHTLHDMGSYRIPKEAEHYFQLNSDPDKKWVAIIKMMEAHRHFNMQPMFEWEFKALPLVVGWFDMAATISLDDVEDVQERKLSSIYQFVRGMPGLYVQCRLSQELSEVQAAKMKLGQGRLNREGGAEGEAGVVKGGGALAVTDHREGEGAGKEKTTSPVELTRRTNSGKREEGVNQLPPRAATATKEWGITFDPKRKKMMFYHVGSRKWQAEEPEDIELAWFNVVEKGGDELGSIAVPNVASITFEEVRAIIKKQLADVPEFKFVLGGLILRSAGPQEGMWRVYHRDFSDLIQTGDGTVERPYKITIALV